MINHKSQWRRLRNRRDEATGESEGAQIYAAAVNFPRELRPRRLTRADGGAVLAVTVSAKVKGAEGADVSHPGAMHGELPHELDDVGRGAAHRIPQDKVVGYPTQLVHSLSTYSFVTV